MSNTYYDSDHWLAPGNPSDIGGRATDIAQIGRTIESRIKERFPVNQVPVHIELMLSQLHIALCLGERMIEDLIFTVSKTRL